MADRAYPERPFIGVGAVIVVGSSHVVLVRRRHEPMAGRWSLPGGAVEIGEPLAAAVMREVAEETGLVVDVGPLIDVVDRIVADEGGRTRYHYVLADYLCRATAGNLAAGTDADEVVLVDVTGLDPYDLPDDTRRVIEFGVEMASEGWESA